MRALALESRGILLLVLARELQLSLLRRPGLLLQRPFMSRYSTVAVLELKWNHLSQILQNLLFFFARDNEI